MAEWRAKYPNDYGEYEITFASKDREEVKTVEKVCCAIIDKKLVVTQHKPAPVPVGTSRDYADGYHDGHNKGYEDGLRDAVVHGHWVLKVHKGSRLYHGADADRYWTVTAECSECGNEKCEVSACLVAFASDEAAKAIALEHAKKVQLPKYCSDCGAKMDLEVDDG